MPLSTLSSQRKPRRRINADINITPLVDVMLVLLVIFMVTAPMLMSGIHINLPGAAMRSAAVSQDPIVISINANGKIYLADKLVDTPQLIEGLNAATKDNPQAKVFIEGDKDLAYAEIIKVIAEINQAGFTKVVLLTKIQDGK